MHTVKDIMTKDLVTCPETATVAEAAQIMRDRNIGDVLVTSDRTLRGIVTDRDIVVRCLAEGGSADARIDRACSTRLTTIGPDASLDEAARVMRENNLRRVPVVDDGRAVGIISLGDLAVELDPKSTLGDISAARPNN